MPWAPLYFSARFSNDTCSLARFATMLPARDNFADVLDRGCGSRDALRASVALLTAETLRREGEVVVVVGGGSQY